MEKIKTIYCDFDGTITKEDTVNKFFEMYADPRWIESEKLWIEGKISSRENAIIQVGMLNKVSKNKLSEFIDSIEIDDYFLDFYNYTQENNIKLTILSDGYDLFISETLKKYNIKNVNFFANHLIHKSDNKFAIEFPLFNENCIKASGMCKCAQAKEVDFCYIGDGNSDICVAKNAKVLFAKKFLANYCNKNDINYYLFNNFHDIIDVVKSF